MGKYCKYSRILSQTQWVVEGRACYESSIEQEIGNIMTKFFLTEEYKFHSGGREDIDVRMLNEGRPFVIEMLRPKRSTVTQEDIDRLQEEVNASSTTVNINSLHQTDNTCFALLKESETNKIKGYCCVMTYSKRPTVEQVASLAALKDLTLHQTTPLRVVHRRTLMVRPKVIHQVRLLPVNDSYGVLFVLAAAGTYIKEFVHGDLQRTTPNIGTLLGDPKCDILQLDVVHLYEKYDQQAVQHFESICKLDSHVP